MTIESIEKKILELEQRIQVLETNQKLTEHTSFKISKKQQSLREFLNQKNPKTANDQGLCIAYYHEILKEQGGFNVEDIRNGFFDARLPAPKNPNDVINKNIRKAYIMSTKQTKEGKKTWVLTNTGIEVVEKGFHKQ